MKYQNITISGLPGSGSTTLLKLLKHELEMKGWKGFSGGEFMRAYALEHGSFEEQSGLHHDSSHYADEFDRSVDMDMRGKLSREKNWIIESWLSGFLAQKVPGVLKILMHCSDDAVRVDRIVNRDRVTVETALENMRVRTQNNLAKWTRMYANEWQEWVVSEGKAKPHEKIDFWRPELYDVCIDTYKSNREQSLQIVLKELTKSAQSKKQSSAKNA